MKLKLFFIAFWIFCSNYSNAQLTGSTDVCAGYVYDYSVTVSGGATYTWSLPGGWVILSGQGTSQIHVLCNSNVGQVCVASYDGSGTLISTLCNTVVWGGGGTGWDAILTPTSFCNCSPFTISVVPNSGICPGTCGTGIMSPKSFFAVYDNVWGSGVYQGPADNATYYNPPLSSNFYTWYIYLIDTSLGAGNPILIEGGSCAATVNNTVGFLGCTPIIGPVDVNPTIVCIGDTFTVTDPFPAGFYDNWMVYDPELTIVSSMSNSALIAAVGGPGFYIISFTSSDGMGCNYFGQGVVQVQSCVTIPSANFNANVTSICPSSCVNFTNTSSNGISYHWSFPGAFPDTSTVTNPTNICYSSSGYYDVTLIAENANGSDTLLLPNYIEVRTLILPAIYFTNDTISVDPIYTTYQWYHDNNLIPGANDYFYPVTLDGDYIVVVQDSNGCQQTAEMFGVVAGITKPDLSAYIHIFPNPASESVSIQNMNPSDDLTQVSLVDQTGQTINLYTSEKNKTISFHTNDISSGIYILKIQTKNGISYKKLVVQH